MNYIEEEQTYIPEPRNKYIISFRDQMSEHSDVEFIGTWVNLMQFCQTLRRNGYRCFQIICTEQSEDDLPF